MKRNKYSKNMKYYSETHSVSTSCFILLEIFKQIAYNTILF